MIYSIALCFLVALNPTAVQSQEYEEVSYEDLVQRLSKKKSKVIHNQVGASALDDIMIHMGVGLSTSSLEYFDGLQTQTKQVNGFQLSFGIDLFSSNWASEMLFRNLGGNSTESVSGAIKSFREFNLRILYRQPSQVNSPGFRIGGGLGNRFLRIEEQSTRFEESSPLFVLFTGLEYSLNQNFSLGAEIGYRSALIPEIHDKHSVDLLFRLDTYF